MTAKRLIALALAVMMLICISASAQVQYLTDIVVSGRALDGSEPDGTPEPSPAPEPSPTPAPTPEPYTGAYEIEVDLHNQIVTVYRGEGRTEADIARQMICSSGENNSTPLGEFIMPEVQKVDEREAWYYIGKFRLHVQYASRIVRDILFHSLPSTRQAISPTEDSRLALGSRASHGCIRLRPSDSRWIAENCPPGTLVRIYDEGFANEDLRKLLLESSFDSALAEYPDFLNGAKLLSISSELPEVAALQEKLNALGYACSETDGLFGAATHSAVVLWQQANGYTPNGEVDPAQYEALMKAEITNAAPVLPGRLAHVKVDTALTLREGPSSKSNKLATLANGTAVYVLEEQGYWQKISVNAMVGYVGRDYIEFAD